MRSPCSKRQGGASCRGAWSATFQGSALKLCSWSASRGLRGVGFRGVSGLRFMFGIWFWQFAHPAVGLSFFGIIPLLIACYVPLAIVHTWR